MKVARCVPGRGEGGNTLSLFDTPCARRGDGSGAPPTDLSSFAFGEPATPVYRSSRSPSLSLSAALPYNPPHRPLLRAGTRLKVRRLNRGVRSISGTGRRKSARTGEEHEKEDPESMQSGGKASPGEPGRRR